jgi:hypothetical protein
VATTLGIELITCSLHVTVLGNQEKVRMEMSSCRCRISISGRATPDAAGRWKARPELPYLSGIECGGGEVSSYCLDPFGPPYKIKSDAVRLWLTPVNTIVNSAVVFASTSA